MRRDFGTLSVFIFERTLPVACVDTVHISLVLGASARWALWENTIVKLSHKGIKEDNYRLPDDGHENALTTSEVGPTDQYGNANKNGQRTEDQEELVHSVI